MIKRLNPNDLVALIAVKAGVSADTAKAVLRAQAEVVYANGQSGVRIPGLGLFQLMSSAPREMVMRFGPKAGQTIRIPGKQRLKFRVARVAKDVMIGQLKDLPDLFVDHLPPDLQFSNAACEIHDIQSTLDRLNIRVIQKDTLQTARLFQLADLNIPSGHMTACDPYFSGGQPPLDLDVAPGRYNTFAMIRDGWVALLVVRFIDARPTRWEPARTVGEDGTANKSGTYGIDSATGSFSDSEFQKRIAEAEEDGMDINDQITAAMHSDGDDSSASGNWVHLDSPTGSMVCVSTGSDGSFPTYVARDKVGKAIAVASVFSEDGLEFPGIASA